MADISAARGQTAGGPMAFVRSVDVVNGLLVKLCGLALAVMVACTFWGVLVRFILTAFDIQISAPWTEEVSRYLMIWTVFVGGAVAARQAKLIGVEVLVQALPEVAGKSLKYLAHVISISFYATMFVVGVQWIEFGGSQISPVLEIPMTYIYSSMAVGAAFMILNTITLVVEAIALDRDIRGGVDDELEEALAQHQSQARKD